MPETMYLPLDSVRLYQELQPRVQHMNDDGYVSTRHVEALRDSDPALWPPILVTPDPDNEGRYMVLDGFHRVTAAVMLDLAEIVAEVIPEGGYYEAFVANRTHGLPLSTADRKAFARWLHLQRPDLSLRQLGRESGLSPHTVKAAIEPSQSSDPCGEPVQIAQPPISPEQAAATLLRSVQRLWNRRHSLPSNGSESLATAELADAIRASVARNPDEWELLSWLRSVLETALSS